MKNYFVLTYSKECDLETVQDAVDMLKEKFGISTIALPEMLCLQNYTKKDLMEMLKIYSDHLSELTYEPCE
jgi:hypothetical protein